MEKCICQSQDAINDLDKRLIKVETEVSVMKDDITEIKQSLKESRVFILTTLVGTLISAIGVIIMLMR